MKEFSIIPALGRKTDVPPNDPGLFKDYGGNIATHDVGGENFDLSRKRHSCAKINGYAQWSNSANASATKCLNLFELYSGGNRDLIYADNGVIYVYDSSRDPVATVNFIVPFDSGSEAPTIGDTLEETGDGADASGTLAAFEVTAGTWGGGNAAGKFYLSASTGTWSDDLAIGIDGGAADIATVNGTATATTFATDNVDLYSALRLGDYFVFADRSESPPHKWKNGDTYLTPLSATAPTTDSAFYKFRYIVSFARRVIGLHCSNDTSAPELSIRWSSAWPDTAITSLTFASGDQLWIPNDDPIVGAATMGSDRCFIYCENSIQQLVYFKDYSTPFGCFTVVPQIGAANHHSIINLGSFHLFYNNNDGFMRYTGAGDPVPISDDIKTDIATINSDYSNLIVGCYAPGVRCAVWTVPMYGSSTPNRLLFYQLDTEQWFIVNRSMRFLDFWKTYSSYTWNDLIRDLGGTGATWAGAGTNTFAQYCSLNARLVYANTDGQLYSHSGESAPSTSVLEGYRVEPILSFGSDQIKNLLQEIWIQSGYYGSHEVRIYHRSGDTVGECEGNAWEFIGSIALNSDKPVLHLSKSARLHQIKWGTMTDNEYFEINKITFRYQDQSEN